MSVSFNSLFLFSRSPADTPPSPLSPLSRSPTFEKLNGDDGNALRRPSTLALSQKTASPRHVKMPSSQQRFSYPSTQKHSMESTAKPRAMYKTDAVSPTSHQNSSNIPKFHNKAQPSLIPNRRSMIPTPGKLQFPDN